MQITLSKDNSIPLTEQDLIIGCIREDRVCQRELFRLYAGKMLTVCTRYARHHQEAEDILQDAFIKVFDNISKFQAKGSFEGWIRKIVINTALKNYKKSSFQKELIGVEDYPENSIDPSVIPHMQAEELLKIIEGLPEGYRIVFNLYAIEGFSHKEIAEMLNIKESTSRSQLVKARKMLQERILKLQKIAS